MKTKRPGDKYVSYCLAINSQDDRLRFVALIKIPHAKQANVELFHKGREDFDRVLHGDEIVEITEDGKANCRCLEVEVDHSFVANGITAQAECATTIVPTKALPSIQAPPQT